MHPTGQTAHRGEGQKMRAPPSASTPTRASDRQVTMLSLPVMLTPFPRPERCPSGNPGPCPDFPTLYRDTAAWWGANPSSSLAPGTWFWFCFLRPSKAGGAGSIPGQGAKSTHALRFKIRKKKNQNIKQKGFHRWVEKNPWRRAWQPTPVFLPGEFHGLCLQSMGSQRVGHDCDTCPPPAGHRRCPVAPEAMPSMEQPIQGLGSAGTRGFQELMSAEGMPRLSQAL